MKELPDAKHFEVSSEYYAEILAWNRKHSAASDAAFIDKLDRYHLGCNLKGKRVLSDLTARLSHHAFTLKNKRVLDLGSGTGGTLYGAICLGAEYCEGWEVNDTKLTLSKLNLGTLQIPTAQSSATLISRNMESGLPETSKPFDIVVCQEVLEHVKDLPSSLSGLKSCLKPDNGLAYVSVPNGFSVANVMQEPHILVFGLSLLTPPDSGQLAVLIKNHLNYAHMMGAYHHFSEYAAAFKKAGLQYKPIHIVPPCDIQTGLDLIKTLRNKWSEIKPIWKNQIPQELLSIIDRKLNKYTSLLLTPLQPESFNHQTWAQDYMVNTFEFLLSSSPSDKLPC